MDDELFGMPTAQLFRDLRYVPGDCASAFVRVTVSGRLKEPFREDRALNVEYGRFVATGMTTAIDEKALTAATVFEYPYQPRLGDLLAAARSHHGDGGSVAVIVALFVQDSSQSWRSCLLTSVPYLGNREGQIRELVGGPDSLLRARGVRPLAREASATMPAGPDADEGNAVDVAMPEPRWIEEATSILTGETAHQLLSYANHWRPIGHLRDAVARLMSGGFLGMRAEVLQSIVDEAQRIDGGPDAQELKRQIEALIAVNTGGAHTWIARWRGWGSPELTRVEIVENNEWNELVHTLIAGMLPDEVESAARRLPPRGPYERERYALREPTSVDLFVAEVRFLLTSLFRPELPNRMVTVEILQILGSGRSGAVTFLVQPRLRIDPTIDDPAFGIDSRVGRVSVVKIDDVGLIAREHAGFTNVVDRYLYSYAARISRVAKAHRLGALAYASIGSLDDYSVDLGGASGPISLREFIRGGARRRGQRQMSPVVSSPGDVVDLVTAIDRCVFADLHQDSHPGMLSFAHYSDTLPADYRVDGIIAFIAKPDQGRRIHFDEARVNQPQDGACDGRVVSVGRSSMYLLGDVYQATTIPDTEPTAQSWECLSRDDPNIGHQNAVIQVTTNTRGMVATLVGLAKHMRTEVVPMLQLVAYGAPVRNTWDIGGEVFKDGLLPRAQERGLLFLPWCLLGMLRNNLLKIPARIGSTHGDLNLTNVLVTFLTKPQTTIEGHFDPRCWLIDYEKTRLNGHTGRDYGQLEVGVRREILAPTYIDLCRQLTAAAAQVTRDQARCVLLAYHWLLEEQLVRHDTAPPHSDLIDLEFETIAFTDPVLPLYRSLRTPADITDRIRAARGEPLFSGEWLRPMPLHDGYSPGTDDLAHVLFVHVSSNQMLRRCYHLLRMLRHLSLSAGHERMELLWAQMLSSIAVFSRPARSDGHLGHLEREIVFVGALISGEEIRCNLSASDEDELRSRLQRADGSAPYGLD